MFKENVEKGVHLLNEKCPGWFEKIDLEKLFMQSCDECVLGQLFGNFIKGTGILLPGASAIDFGFSISAYNFRDSDWSALREEWIKQIVALKDRKNLDKS